LLTTASASRFDPPQQSQSVGGRELTSVFRNALYVPAVRKKSKEKSHQEMFD